MKAAKHNSIIALVLAVFAVTMLGAAQSAAANANSNLSKKELKALLKSATTPAEHRAIAGYYRQRALAFTKSSQEHLKEAEVRAKNPAFPALEAKHGYAFGLGASHCRFWGASDAEQAKKAEALAVLHEDMAVKAELKSNKVVAVASGSLSH